MSDQRQRFGDARIAVVAFAEPTRVSQYRDQMQARMSGDHAASGLEPIAFLSDPERLLYRALDLQRTSLGRIYNPGTIKMYAQLIRQGRRLRRPTEDTRQLGGDAVLAPDGTLHSVFRPDSPDDRPSIDQLVAAVDDARR